MPTRLNILDEVPVIESPGVDLGLSRRKRRCPNSRNTAVADTASVWINPISACPRLPNEMLDEIVKFYFDSVVAFSLARRDSQRVAFFRYIQPLTLVSRDVRYLILRLFCRNLIFLTPRDADKLFDYLTSIAASFNGIGGVAWVRNLSLPAFLLPKSILILNHLQNLQDLVVDCSHCSLSTQIVTLSRVFDAVSNEDNLFPNLRSFVMTNVPRLDDVLLKAIAGSLPQVVNLHISTVEGIELGCCRHCYEESLKGVVHSPIHDIYYDDNDLAEKFSVALERLRKLKNLHLGILLSSCDLLDRHAKHGDESRPSTVKSIPNCPQCTKYAQTTRRRELCTGLAIANRLPSLETISWATAFAPSPSRDGKPSEENCVECDADRYPNSLQYSFTEAGPHTKDMDDDHWKVVSFAVQRLEDKIRLSRMRAT